MKVIVNGRNIDLTDALKGHVEDKMEKLRQHYDFIANVEVFLSVDKNPSIKDNAHAEVSIHTGGQIIRVSVATTDMYKSIDELTLKAERGLRKHKNKLVQRSQGRHHGESIRKHDAAEPGAGFDDEEFEIFELDESQTTNEEKPALAS